jgi:hypothetical protein
MPRLYRKQPDSSAFTQPRVLVRVFAEPGQLEQTVRGYESLTKTALDMDLDAGSSSSTWTRPNESDSSWHAGRSSR